MDAERRRGDEGGRRETREEDTSYKDMGWERFSSGSRVAGRGFAGRRQRSRRAGGWPSEWVGQRFRAQAARAVTLVLFLAWLAAEFCRGLVPSQLRPGRRPGGPGQRLSQPWPCPVAGLWAPPPSSRHRHWASGVWQLGLGGRRAWLGSTSSPILWQSADARASQRLRLGPVICNFM